MMMFGLKCTVFRLCGESIAFECLATRQFLLEIARSLASAR